MKASIYLYGALCLSAAGCLRTTAYKCDTSDQCGAGGTCEATHYCSFADSSCGRRYGASAGPLANQCVGGGGVDSGVNIDSPKPIDAMGSGSADAAPNCPSDFMTLSGAPAARRYKLIATATNWVNQKAACTNLSTHAWLAYPENTADLAAMNTLAGTANPVYWLGISDLPPATTWTTVKGTTPPYLPWDTGTPSSNPNDQCVESLRANATVYNDRCTMTFPAICACE